jgi:histidinol-phosphate aminotransferase
MSSDLSFTTEAMVNSLVRPEVLALHSYHVPDASGLLKLDAMENPFPWPGKFKQEWLEKLSNLEVNRYPDPSCAELKQKIANLLKIDSVGASTGQELQLLLGNGSDEIIQILAMALATESRGVLSVEPSFVMYRMISAFAGVPYHGVELDENFELDLPLLLSAIEAHDPALIFLAVPNNPTGNVFDVDDLEAVIQAAKGLVVLDEAYMAFTDSDLLPLAAKYPNVVVMRTFSKVGLAGLRLGFLVGSKHWVEQLEKLRLPYNINVLTQASAALAIDHYDTLAEQSMALRSARSNLLDELACIAGLDVFPSEANFVLVRCPNHDARAVFEGMKSQGVLIKCLDGGHPLLKGCLRLTVGSESENVAMLTALKQSLS